MPDHTDNSSRPAPFRLDRGAFAVVALDEQDDDGAYWQTRTVEDRMKALEYLRRMTYGPAATARLQRVFAVAELGDD